MNIVKRSLGVIAGVLAILISLAGYVVGVGFAITIIGLIVAVPIWIGSTAIALGGLTLVVPEFGRRLDEQYKARRLARSTAA